MAGRKFKFFYRIVPSSEILGFLWGLGVWSLPVWLAGVSQNVHVCRVPNWLIPWGAASTAGVSWEVRMCHDHISALHLPLRSWSSGGRLHQCRYTTDSRRTMPLRRPRRCWIGVSRVPGSWREDCEGHRTVLCSICFPSVFVFFSCRCVSWC